MSESIIEISNLSKTYDSGFSALKNVNLNIKKGEIFALLGPNGAGKTTLISIICGIVNKSQGEIKVAGLDIIDDFRQTRSMIGLVPQELSTETFENVRNTVAFSRGLFGKPKNDALIEKILKDLSLWDKKDDRIMSLSGGMKRRVLIAKALSHEPDILFLDEPTAGVDVELRKNMWQQVHELREKGVTIILTTHYIEEAEEMADRIGVINRGEIVLVEDKDKIMKRLGEKNLCIYLTEPMKSIPSGLQGFDLSLEKSGQVLKYTYKTAEEDSGIEKLNAHLKKEGVSYMDLQTRQSSLEEIFVKMVQSS